MSVFSDGLGDPVKGLSDHLPRGRHTHRMRTTAINQGDPAFRNTWKATFLPVAVTVAVSLTSASVEGASQWCPGHLGFLQKNIAALQANI